MEKHSTRRSRKNTAKKPKGTVQAANPALRYELLGIAVLVAGLLALAGTFGLNAGFVGGYAAKCMEYLFGAGSLPAIVVLILIGVQYIAKHHGIRYTPRFFGIVALYVSMLALYHHLRVPPGAEILPDSLPDGGGLVGGGVLLLVRKLFGVDGGVIVLGAGTLGSVLLATTWSLASGIKKTERHALNGAAVAGNALSSAYGRVVEAGGRIEDRVEEFAKSLADSAGQDDASEAPRPRMSARTLEDQIPDWPGVSPKNSDAGDLPLPALKPSDAPISSAPLTSYESLASITRTVQHESHLETEPETRHDMPQEIYEKVFNDSIEDGTAEKTASPQQDSPGFTIEYSRTVSSNVGVEARQNEADIAGNVMDVLEPSQMEASAHSPTTATTSSQPASKEHPYELPKVQNLLSKHVKQENAALEMEIQENARTLQKTLENFKVGARIVNACHGPAVTRYELEPAPGVKVSKITGLADDLALSLAAFSVRIEPIPGKSAIGIEVPNRELEGVQLREVLEDPAFERAKSKLTVGLGKDIGGQAIFADLAKMPHLLVAGATGSGKSVCINTLITSILFKATPDETKFILIDPKMVELSGYNGIPHLMVPVVTDAKKAASVLNWAVQEMEKRYGKFAESGVRNMETYNGRSPDTPMAAIVIIIDELADLMMVAPHDVEDAICRLAQKARAAGIHLVLATQRPSVDVITGIIKANIPSRISFAVSSQIDSRTILDMAGAEKLLGKGDMLFYPIGSSKPARVQGAFVSDSEVEHLLDFIRAQGMNAEPDQEIIEFTEQEARESEEKTGKGKENAPPVDELLEDAVLLVMSSGIASSSGIQRRFRIGYTRAARLLDTMEELHIVGPSMGSKPREILMTGEQALDVVHSAAMQQMGVR